MSFSALGLSGPLLQAIADMSYTQPYPIQREAIPVIIAGKDVYGIAQTGSGKTASFVLPILERLQGKRPSSHRHVRALILVPTRELAMQVCEVCQSLGANLPTRLKSVAVYGGVSINPQMIAVQHAEIIIATPGRLLDLIDKNALHLSQVEILVLDEADKMLNLGFRDEMKEIFQLLPEKRQNILFSATLDHNVDVLNNILLHDPVRIEIKEETQRIDQIHQIAYRVEDERKGVLLRYLIKEQHMQQVLVFTSSTRRADNVVVKLLKNGISAAALHSDKSQGARTEALRNFRNGKLRVLVATDLASRGIDIQFLPYVINYELPRSPTDYVHRIGRTGRAESSGEAISLICPADEHHFKIIQKKMGRRVEMKETADLDLKGY
ncbi:MAG: DEAD/DEAH box helicase [Cytophagales bacterium]|nr:DEAD/DEAH box helicase [Cytophagales bacterium]